ncbi:hypothetical protein BDB00DRAFT_880319 [Zychaea mexicana]|uniref:uncharacterized protein n=1 Tax=Zychaea mexicana TaxID=64656 RepID=UPI0022FDE772|nr:uncharacterized protein BDB00DRAFT_880319 [Zychaea mexicana]KAI9468534.1 hypothetical protein BDB00DRAFT_880319 [Zychaea mexicana]
MVPGVTLDPEVEKWEVNGVVVSELLLKYREESIKKGEKQVLDIYQEELSLNGIFLFDDLNCVYPDCSLVYGFDRDTWQAVMNECKELYPAQSLSKKTKKIINKFAEAGAENFDKCDKIVEKLNNKDQIRESLRNIRKRLELLIREGLLALLQDVPEDDRPTVYADNVDWREIIVASNTVDPKRILDYMYFTPSKGARSPSQAFTKEFRQAHEAMDSNLKWKLSTGTVVEDVLFDYGLNCNYEDVAHSFIIDMTCKELMEKFTEKGIEEIGERSKHPLPDIPEKLMECVNGYVGLTTIECLETRVRKRLYAFGTDF